MLGTIHRGLPPLMVAIGLVFLTVIFQNCGDGFQSPPSQSLKTDSISCDADGCESTAPALIQCNLQNISIDDSETITAYLDPTVPFGQSCDSEIRTCTNGQLSGSYPETECAPEPGRDCVVGDMTVTHGTTLVAWAEESVISGEGTCQSEDRICNNGAINGNYQYTSCVERQPENCVLDGESVANGTTIPAFNLPTVPFGSQCQSENRVCDNGSLSGTYSYGSCSVGNPSGCSLDGVNVSHGATITAYEQQTVGSGDTCVSEDQICSNGSLSGSYEYGSCSISSGSSCMFNGETIESGEGAVAFQNSAADSNGHCEFEQRICEDGTLSGSFTHSNCEGGSAPAVTMNLLHRIANQPVLVNGFTPYRLDRLRTNSNLAALVGDFAEGEIYFPDGDLPTHSLSGGGTSRTLYDFPVGVFIPHDRQVNVQFQVHLKSTDDPVIELHHHFELRRTNTQDVDGQTCFELILLAEGRYLEPRYVGGYILTDPSTTDSSGFPKDTRKATGCIPDPVN